MACSYNYIISAAIDFGTTYSGYAFSFRHDHDQDPLMKISTNTWSSGSSHLLSLKTPSSVLFSPDGKFHSFGYEAEDKLADLTDNEDPSLSNWFFFQQFKMELYDQQAVNRYFKLKTANGLELPAIKVFSESIGYLRKRLLHECCLRLGDSTINEEDVRWVLTVPAIWSDAAKNFMREAAAQAGIQSHHLFLALEPECASMFCKQIDTQKRGKDFEPFTPGSRYMVLDIGGGTLDITVHEVNEDSTLRELHMANGGAWGGTKVDNSFRRLLASIVGPKAFRNFCAECRSDMVDMFRDFEGKKRSVLEGKQFIVISIPVGLEDICRRDNNSSVEDMLKGKQIFAGKIQYRNRKLRISMDTFRDLFTDVMNNIVKTVRDILRLPNLHDVNSILLVGGFSESPLVVDRIRNAFPYPRKVIVPLDPGLAVLKGAVIFGHEPMMITTRICRLTYGVSSSDVFCPGQDPVIKRYISSTGEARCRDIFSMHVQRGQEIRVGEPQVQQMYHFVDPRQTHLTFELFSSIGQDPRFVSDPGCMKVGTLRIESPSTGRGLNRCVQLQMTFSGTEIEVEAKDPLTNKCTQQSFTLLEDGHG